MKLKIILFLIGLFSLQAFSEEVQFKKTKLKVGKIEIAAEVANTSKTRQHGLMFRKNLSDKEGMIFIFDLAEVQGFWMKNTLIPLSIGFFDRKGTLNEVLDMQPASPMEVSPSIYRSKSPAKYALEVPLGWFQRKKIKVGAKLSLPELKLP